MADEELLTVAEAAAIFRVTLQTIRNWIEWGKLPALRVGRRFLVRREHIDLLLDQAQASEDGAYATARDVWDPSVSRLVQRRAAPASASVWDNDSDAPALPPKRASPPHI